MANKSEARQKKILVTGFDPFDMQKVNPASQAVFKLPDEISGAAVIKLEVPTVFGRAAQVVREAIIKEQPDCVLCVGQAGGRACLTPELVAINYDDAGVPDNAGQQPVEQVIQADGQAAYFTQFPVKKLVSAIRKAGVPAKVSTTAGTFVCNHLMYQVQYLREQEFPQLKAGFIHVPFVPEQVTRRPNSPSMALATIVKGLEAAIAVIVEN